MIFNDIISKELLNEYAGSEKKKTVILNDGNKYLLKLPDPARELDSTISYINNAFSEYLGCKIAKSMGLDVQDVILGVYIDKNGNEKISCACKDLCTDNYKLREIDTISNSLELDSTDLKKITFENSEKILENICPDKSNILIDAYYDMFILDALIGNTDRHNGNWAVLVNDNGDIKKCPIYDCGSCLLPLVDTDKIATTNIEQLNHSITSAITENGKRIAYGNFLSSTTNEKIKNALKKIVPKINLNTIFTIIDESHYIPEIRRNMYKNIIKSRFEKIIIPALENCFPLVEVAPKDNLEI